MRRLSGMERTEIWKRFESGASLLSISRRVAPDPVSG